MLACNVLHAICIIRCYPSHPNYHSQGASILVTCTSSAPDFRTFGTFLSGLCFSSSRTVTLGVMAAAPSASSAERSNLAARVRRGPMT